MIHIVDSNSFYYSKEDHKFYFVNETSRFNYVVAEVLDGLEPDKNSHALPDNQFSLIKKKKEYYIIPEENLNIGCFYISDFFEDNCANISVDYDNTTCKVIGCFIKQIKSRCLVKFAILLRSRKYITFDIVFSSGEKFKKVYTYDAREREVIFEVLDIKRWDSITKNLILDDYDDKFEVEVNLEFLDTIKDSGFVIKKWGDKK